MLQIPKAVCLNIGWHGNKEESMSIRLTDGEYITTITMIEGDGADISADFSRCQRCRIMRSWMRIRSRA